MRVYSNSQSWLDLEGKPLVGRVTFYKFHTTTPEVITDVNGTPLANPVFTNQIGQLTHDVFLKNDTDYTVYFEKYIGNASMEDDPDNWQFQYSSDNIFTEYIVDIESDALQAVNNITDLRAISPAVVEDRDGHKIISLLGYNTAGDKPEVLYIYDPTSIVSDNGGSVIKPDDESTGRWILVNTFEATNGIDVRHLGVFGTYTRQSADTMSAQIAIANNYATSVGIPLYFPRLDEGTTWYKMNNLVIKGIFADDTRVYSKTGSHTTITLVKEIDHLSVLSDSTYNGEFTINGNVVRSSYGVLSSNVHFVPSETFVVDSSVVTTYKTMTGVAVKTDRTIFDWTFNSCTFDGVIKHMGSRNTFTNCRLTQLMFTSAFANCVVDDTDVIDIDDWPDTSKWWSLRKQQSSRTLDMHNRTISNVDVDLSGWTDCVIVNATLDNYVVHADVYNISFKNCTGAITFTAIGMGTSFANCNNMIINYAAGNHAYTSIKNSNIAIGTTLSTNSVEISDSDVSGTYILQSTVIIVKRSSVTLPLDCMYLTAETSTLSQIAVKVPSITHCILTGPISQVVDAAVVNFILDGNTFKDGSYHAISSSVPNTVVNGIWINNVSLLNTHFIVLDRTNLDSNEQHHDYTYENNSGKHTLQKLSAKWNDTITLYHVDNAPVMDCRQVLWMNNRTNGWNESRCQTTTDQSGNIILDPNIWLTELEFFSVGTDPNYMPNFKLTVTPVRRLLNVRDQTSYVLCGNTVPVDSLSTSTQSTLTTALPGILFAGNYKWRLYKVCELFYALPFWTTEDESTIWNVHVSYELEAGCPQVWGTQVTI